jgi:DNA-binding MarR family transcriptional regulator
MDDGAPDLSRRRRPDETLGEIGLWHFAPYLMNRIMGRYNADVQQELRPEGLTTAKMRTLAVLTVVPGLTVNELSIYTVTEPSTMSRTLEAMEAAGRVRRTGRPSDGRVREVFLTEEGRAEFERVWPVMYDGYRRMFDGIPEEERAAFVGVLQRVLTNIRKHDI